MMQVHKLLHICTINCKGLQQAEKRNRIIEWTNQQKCNILFMQETHFTDNLMKKLDNDFPGDFFLSNGTSSARGVAIWVKKGHNFKIVDSHNDSEGRFLLINVEINESMFTLVNIYAPNNSKARNIFFKYVKTSIDNYSLGQLVIGGDFNDILSEQDTKNKIKNQKFDKPVNSLKTLIRSLKITDIWREKNVHKTQFTWSRKNRSEATRIDYFLIGSEVKKNCFTCDIRPVVLQYTDHNSVSFKININRGNKGRGYWKLNSSILEDDEYITIIKQLIMKYKEKAKNHKKIDVLWDNFKIEVRDHTIDYCKQKGKKRKNIINVLEANLKNLNAEIDANNDKDEIFNKSTLGKIEKIEEKLSKLYTDKIRGNQIRSRIKWIEEGEKNSAYFLGLEKTRQSRKTISQLYDENKQTTIDQEKILKLEVQYYKNLYSSNNPELKEIEQYLENIKEHKKLGDHESNKCEGEITEEECNEAIFKMKLNRAPGLDGLNVEFYRKFWTDIKDLIVLVFNFCFNQGELTNTQKTGAISLIYKKNDPLSLDNYRPITLLNYDVKLLAYSLAQRLKTVIPKIIHTDQKGYIRNRYIGFNIRQIQDVIDYSENFKIDGAILFLDFSKAFDSLEWNFMFETLRKFGFKENFIKWVKVMYTDIQGCILNNGWVSSPFKVFRGIRQGCPCSSLLFVLAVEIMAIKLRDNKKLKGLEIKLDGKNCNLKICQLADDTTLFLKSRKDITLAINLIETFGSLSGLKLNRNKTEGFWLGKLKHSRDKFENVNWCTNPIKSLGVYFGYNYKECQKLNFEKQFKKCENIINDWNKRNITLIGKIVVVKSLILPNLTYLASNTIISKDNIQRFKTLIYNFIWKSKRDKIKRTTLSKDYSEGGLRMIDIDLYIKSIQTRWIIKLQENKCDNWTVIPRFYLNKFGKNLLLFKMNLNNVRDLDTATFGSMSEFYQQLVKTWISIKGGQTKSPKNFLDVRKQVIWGNNFIRLNRKCLFFKNWIQNDIIYINDIIDNQGFISENLILAKLSNKEDWIRQVLLIKKAIPKHWQNMLKLESSYKTNVNINRSEHLHILFNQYLTPNTSNKEIYKILLNQNIQDKPVGFLMWERFFHKNLSSVLQNTSTFIFDYLNDNKLKMFKWKIIHFILPCNDLLFKWKILDTNLCTYCNTKDDYEHFFFLCRYNHEYWQEIYKLFTFLQIDKHLFCLENLVTGYKIHDIAYFEINYILTIVFFSIYKAHYASNQKEKKVNIFSIFKTEIYNIIALHNSRKEKQSMLMSKILRYIDK